MALQRNKTETIDVKALFPGFIEPALASSIEKVPSGERWIHEIRFDGYRVQLHIANEAIKIYTRSGLNWTKRFKKVAGDAFLIPASSAIIDGEIVVPATDGTTDFSMLQIQLKGKSDKFLRNSKNLLHPGFEAGRRHRMQVNPFARTNSKVPPSARTRSCIPVNPRPKALPGGMPSPLSATSIHT